MMECLFNVSLACLMVFGIVTCLCSAVLFIGLTLRLLSDWRP
jgi:hypothetical protein